MTRQPENLISRTNFTRADFGSPDQWMEHGFMHSRLGKVAGKVFLRETLSLSSMEVSLTALPPGASVPFLHAHHQNEELYVFISGEGEFQVDGEVFAIGAGSSVRVAPGGMRSWRAKGTEPLTCLVIQAKAGSLEQATGEDGVLGENVPVW